MNKALEDKFYEFILADDASSLKSVFHDTDELLKYANPKNRDSLISQIVEHRDDVFLDMVLRTYFPNKESNILDKKEEFLKGTDKSGKKMNFHYFKNYLPQLEVEETLKAFNVVPDVDYTDDSIEAARMQGLYNVIKSNRVEVSKAHAPSNIDKFRQIDIMLTPTGEIAIPSENNIKLDFPPIILRHVADNETKNDYIAQILPYKDEVTPQKSLSERAFEQMDFPEDFIFSAQALQTFEKEWKIMRADENLVPVTEAFINEQGFVRIEDKADNKNKTNIASEYAGLAGVDKYGKSKIILNSEPYTKGVNLSIHEITHRADLSGENIFF